PLSTAGRLPLNLAESLGDKSREVYLPGAWVRRRHLSSLSRFPLFSPLFLFLLDFLQLSNNLFARNAFLDNRVPLQVSRAKFFAQLGIDFSKAGALADFQYGDSVFLG